MKINDTIIKNIEKEAQTYFENACPSHDWSHVKRVYELCIYIGKKEKANLDILKLAALLHDIGRRDEEKDPDNLDHSKISSILSSKILNRYNLNGEIENQVVHCILSHRFRKEQKPETLEAKILYDADKLDSIGAIGIARAYAWAGKKGLLLYSDKNYLGTGYEHEHSPVTEFNYKLSKVKNKLFTETAKKIGEARHSFMESFFNQLNKEVNNKN